MKKMALVLGLLLVAVMAVAQTSDAPPPPGGGDLGLQLASGVQLVGAPDRSEILAGKRRDFNRALTWFLVSLPVPVMHRVAYEIVYQWYEQYPLSQVLTDAGSLSFARAGNMSYFLFLGSAVYSTGLLIYLAVSTSRLIKAVRATDLGDT